MTRTVLRNFLRYFLIPGLFYFIFFAIYTYPWMANFSTAIFGDMGDGLQNTWNLWWIERSLDAGQSPLYTTMLHYPGGTTLLGHTLHLINGVLAYPLLKILPLLQVYNLIVIAAFVGSGLTAFWLCYTISRSYVGSLLGGFVFTFSSYHFAHAFGHMNLITLQWIPLFILAWWQFLNHPTFRWSLAAVVALFAITFTDFYYLLFCIVAAIVLAIYAVLSGEVSLKNSMLWKNGAAFVVLSLLLIAPFPFAVIYSNIVDPLLGAHNPIDYSMDLLSPFIPSQVWRFSSLTEWFWTQDALDIVEGSVNLSIVTIVGLVIGLILVKKLPKTIRPWLWSAAIFSLLSIGPRLHSMGDIVADIPMPYSVAAHLFPPLKLAGVPIRMIVMTMLSSAIVLSIVIGQLNLKKVGHVLLLAIVAIALFFESWPMQLPYSKLEQPSYISALREMPVAGVIDTLNTRTASLYYQTLHEQPLVGGYISRVPTSVDNKDNGLFSMFSNQEYKELAEKHGVRYWLAPANATSDKLKPIYQDDMAIIFDLSSQQ
jgi:hypothetical protein